MIKNEAEVVIKNCLYHQAEFSAWWIAPIYYGSTLQTHGNSSSLVNKHIISEYCYFFFDSFSNLGAG